MKPIIWSPSRISLASKCLKAYYYNYISKEKFPTNGEFAAGVLLHRKMEKFYKEDRTPKYKSPESFANASMAQWQRFNINTGKSRGQPIKWRSENHPYILKHMIGEACKTVYPAYANQQPPIETEFSFEFCFGNRFYRGSIDEIRNNATIRDHKSDGFERPQTSLDNDIQFTNYALAISQYLYADKKLRKKVNISKELKEEIKNKEKIILPIGIEIHYLRTGNIKTTTRNDSHYYELTEIIDELEEQIRRRNFKRNLGKHCDFCLFNEACARDTKQSNIVIPENPQLQLFATSEPKPKNIKQLRLSFPRKSKKV